MSVHLWSGSIYSSWNSYGKNPGSKLKSKSHKHKVISKKKKQISAKRNRENTYDFRSVKIRSNKNDTKASATQRKYEYMICPNCNHKIRKSRYKNHIERKCPVITRDKPKQKNEKIILQRQPNKHICPSCTYYDKEKGNCSLSQIKYKTVFHCLFYKLRSERSHA